MGSKRITGIITQKDAATILKISETHLSDLRRAGNLPPACYISQDQPYFFEDEVKRLFAELNIDLKKIKTVLCTSDDNLHMKGYWAARIKELAAQSKAIKEFRPRWESNNCSSSAEIKEIKEELDSAKKILVEVQSEIANLKQEITSDLKVLSNLILDSLTKAEKKHE